MTHNLYDSLKPMTKRCKPNYPDIKGMDAYKGRMFHASRWEDDYNYEGKRVAVIGSGCTAIQGMDAYKIF